MYLVFLGMHKTRAKEMKESPDACPPPDPSQQLSDLAIPGAAPHEFRVQSLLLLLPRSGAQVP
jgi:hypothetical protein